MYLMIRKRSDLAVAFGKTRSVLLIINIMKWIAIEWVLQYISGTCDLGICFSGSGRSEINAFSGTDWAGGM